jgi:hypothetical protein
MFSHKLLRALNTLTSNGDKPLCTKINGEKFSIAGIVERNNGIEMTYSKTVNKVSKILSEFPKTSVNVFIKIDDNYGDVTRVAYNDEGEIEIFYNHNKIELPQGEIIE